MQCVHQCFRHISSAELAETAVLIRHLVHAASPFLRMLRSSSISLTPSVSTPLDTSTPCGRYSVIDSLTLSASRAPGHDRAEACFLRPAPVLESPPSGRCVLFLRRHGDHRCPALTASTRCSCVLIEAALHVRLQILTHPLLLPPPPELPEDLDTEFFLYHTAELRRTRAHPHAPHPKRLCAAPVSVPRGSELKQYADRTRAAGSQSSYKLCGFARRQPVCGYGREDEAEIIDRQCWMAVIVSRFRDSAYFNQWVHGISPCSHPM